MDGGEDGGKGHQRRERVAMFFHARSISRYFDCLACHSSEIWWTVCNTCRLFVGILSAHLNNLEDPLLCLFLNKQTSPWTLLDKLIILVSHCPFILKGLLIHTTLGSMTLYVISRAVLSNRTLWSNRQGHFRTVLHDIYQPNMTISMENVATTTDFKLIIS